MDDVQRFDMHDRWRVIREWAEQMSKRRDLPPNARRHVDRAYAGYDKSFDAYIKSVDGYVPATQHARYEARAWELLREAENQMALAKALLEATTP